MKSVTGNARYCANCGTKPPTNQRRRSIKGRRLMVCQKCSRDEKRAAL